MGKAMPRKGGCRLSTHATGTRRGGSVAGRRPHPGVAALVGAAAGAVAVVGVPDVCQVAAAVRGGGLRVALIRLRLHGAERKLCDLPSLRCELFTIAIG